jgi:hypothetical protein
MRTCKPKSASTPSGSLNLHPGYTSTSLWALASHTDAQTSVPLRKPLLTCGNSYKSGSQTRVSKSTLLETLESGLNRMADTMVLYFLRESWDTIPDFSPKIVGAYRYFLEKNDEIYRGTATGVHINLKTLGIGNGLTV